MTTPLVTHLKIEAAGYDTKTGQRNRLAPLSRVNVFVGGNNSGKSRLLRSLASRANYEAIWEGYDELRLVNSVDSLRARFTEFNIRQVQGIDCDELVKVLRRAPRLLRTGATPLEEQRQLLSRLLDALEKDPANPAVPESSGFSRSWGTGAQHALLRAARATLEAFEAVPTRTELVRVYVPVLRGLRPLAGPKLSGPEYQDLYALRTGLDYFQDEGSSPPTIFTGNDLYQTVRSLLLGPPEDRNRATDYEQFLSRTVFEGKTVSLIPREKDDVLHVRIGDEEYPIHHLGDGIQAVIVLTFPVATAAADTFFFIEEPEVHLHPGLQRKVLGFFLDRKNRRHQFFLTTHSNHLLDMTADYSGISVFNFWKSLPEAEDDEKKTMFRVQPVTQGDLSSLELLGVRNSSVFLVNATIWVEGITDRLYLRRMLQLLQESDEKLTRIDEDLHYSFVEYGGACLTHWSWLEREDRETINVVRLCGRAILVMDEDDPMKRLKEKAQLKAKLGDRFRIVPGREIENLLPGPVLSAVLKDYRDTPSKRLDFEEYRNEKLGEYLDSVIQQPQKRIASYATNSGTVRDKLTFCQKALEHLDDWEDLDEDVQKLVRWIHRFVVDQNK